MKRLEAVPNETRRDNRNTLDDPNRAARARPEENISDGDVTSVTEVWSRETREYMSVQSTSTKL